ncbi:hypothetical protein [Burkholderia ubonensis]|uniref:hypothetical protein n=1 Tax=Burkholderia ubonensis TaxID=101571 RepID=UPI00075F8C0C|nr:hypothetical protein [Burkholderia ubonensis]KWO64831.1 hypothetical protein WM31_21025 [Burkholderia ubonensis]
MSEHVKGYLTYEEALQMVRFQGQQAAQFCEFLASDEAALSQDAALQVPHDRFSNGWTVSNSSRKEEKA